MKKKNLAFTLAEVLIVIGIIGVVAALTLPNLNHATGDKETVTRVKKTYSALNEAFDRAQAIYGDEDTWYKDLTSYDYNSRNKRFAERITEFLKISKDCGQETGQGCFSSGKAKYLSGSEWGNLDTAAWAGSAVDYRVITSDSSSIYFNYSSKTIIVDIDGPNKGANTFGKDLFLFKIADNFVRDYGYDMGDTIFTHPMGCMSSGNCASTWILNNDNLDYLKADLSTGKCNDSDIILNGTTNTSCH